MQKLESVFNYKTILSPLPMSLIISTYSSQYLLSFAWLVRHSSTYHGHHLFLKDSRFWSKYFSRLADKRLKVFCLDSSITAPVRTNAKEAASDRLTRFLLSVTSPEALRLCLNCLSVQLFSLRLAKKTILQFSDCDLVVVASTLCMAVIPISKFTMSFMTKRRMLFLSSAPIDDYILVPNDCSLTELDVLHPDIQTSSVPKGFLYQSFLAVGPFIAEVPRVYRSFRKRYPSYYWTLITHCITLKSLVSER